MKSLRLPLILLLLLCSIATGCNRGDKSDNDDSSSSSGNRFKVSEIATHVDAGKPVINAIVTNTGSDIHTLTAVVQVLKNNVVIDTATGNLTFPANDGLRKLEKNQSAALEAVFNSIANHTQYDTRRITYTWKEDKNETHTSSASASSVTTITNTTQDEF
jgi:hypothetical protein